ncbi:dimethyl sulfoxide reductase anchor subunit [Alphaproteobacteria bacterium GH1-50]|uniref:Dimethyl sulfoxide reductase anchor subunit n=1 Tax=Kangsaoukella pontilimi TaxID=2691042 RepID=A0A7C9IQJ5_9RHOB|nr:DmsC/YnfH family molybdoenzyme membrane anchor subunit [Kangsaoukella pontilimi]MXQ09290.1 dimethyl sulfoxide reductase anchor subunit [Kangsaoukella pontilimi]
MHPAPSIILFTTLSGLGFGMLFFLGLDIASPRGWVAFVFYLIAFALAVGGLVSSTFHLGHPERALKAFTQWRSSWLSREAVAAVIALGFMGLYALGAVFFDAAWRPLGVVGGVMALVTVFATSMIYMQMRTVPRWNHWSPPVLFLGYALAGGALLTGKITVAMIFLALAAIVQVVAWIDQDRREAASDTTLATATGLGHIGSVRAFEPPHTGGNYLTKEMVFRVGRKHAVKLRIISLALMAALPLLLLLVPFSHIFAALAVLSHIAGVLVQRWLFFAEARHVVGLYYGR